MNETQRRRLVNPLTGSPFAPPSRVAHRPTVKPAGWLTLITQVLASARWPWIAGLTALAFSVTAWKSGFQLDDSYHQAILRGDLTLGNGSPLLDQFCWSAGDLAWNRTQLDSGLLPWWTSAGYRMYFFRPLAAATHAWDQWIWPSQKWLMHVQSSLWFAGASVMVGLLYRRLFALVDIGFAVIRSPHFSRSNPSIPAQRRMALSGAAAAGLASLMYALRDEHAVTVAWIANRNLLMMTVFGTGAWLCHIAWRERGGRWAAWGAPLCFALSLLCGESAVAIGGCLFAYAVALERGAWTRRLLSLAPCGLVGVAWVATYQALHCGATESGMYLDPKTDTLTFALGFVQRTPVYLAGSLGVMSVHGYSFNSLVQQRLLLVVSVLMTATIGWIVRPAIRSDRLLRFFGLCLVFAMLPLCAGLASDRLMMIFDIPATGFIARFIQLVFNEAAHLPSTTSWRRAARGLCGAWIVAHVVMAFLMLPLGILAFKAYGDGLLTSARSPAFNHPGFERQDLILLNAPHGMYPLYMDFARQDEGLPPSRRTTMLAGATSEFSVSRPDERTLVVDIPAGLMQDAYSQIYRNPRQQPLCAGMEIVLQRMTITVLESEGGRPTRLAYRFDVPLEDPALCLAEWRDHQYVPFVPPALGETRQIPQACDWNINHVDPLRKVLGL